MTKPELFDIVELLVNIPQYNLKAETQGTIVECYEDQHYEILVVQKTLVSHIQQGFGI